MHAKQILFFGPYSPPVTGQSMAFRTVVKSYPKENYCLVDTTKYNSSVINAIYSIFVSLKLLLVVNSISVIYLTCTRSRLGSIKDLPLLFVAGIKSKRIINHLHGADFRSFFVQSGLLKPILKRAYDNINTSIVLLDAMAKEFEGFRKMNIEVVSNYYPGEFEEMEIDKPKEIIVTYFSNIIRSKGALEFLNTSKEIYKTRPDIKFVMVGEFMGDDMMNASKMKKEVDNFIQSNPNINFDFHGKVDPEERFGILSRSSIFVLPTYYASEAIPLSIIEAMRCGNVIITTDHNYLPHLIRPQNGSLVPTQDVDKIVKSILHYANNPDLMRKIQLFNIQEAKNNHTEKSYVSSIQEIIRA